MRQFMDIICEWQRPTVLFHGTSEEAWNNIKASNRMSAFDPVDGYEQVICFTASRSVAEEFARTAALADMCDYGTVITFDADKLRASYELVPYHDPEMSGSYTFFLDEEEYRVLLGEITGINDLVMETYRVHLESSRELHDHKSRSDIVRDAILKVRKNHAPHFAGSCEAAAAELSDILSQNHIDNEVIEGRYMKPMVDDGEQYPFTPHWWVEVGNFILDPTREQFGSTNFIINKSKENTDYRYGGVGQVQ